MTTENSDIGVFADFQAADTLLHPNDLSGVDGDRPEGICLWHALSNNQRSVNRHKFDG
jgi:hypothetical protein